MLETINWEEGMSEMNVNEAWSFMRDEIKTVMQKPREKKQTSYLPGTTSPQCWSELA